MGRGTLGGKMTCRGNLGKSPPLSGLRLPPLRDGMGASGQLSGSQWSPAVPNPQPWSCHPFGLGRRVGTGGFQGLSGDPNVQPGLRTTGARREQFLFWICEEIKTLCNFTFLVLLDPHKEWWMG